MAARSLYSALSTPNTSAAIFSSLSMRSVCDLEDLPAISRASLSCAALAPALPLP